MKTETWTKKLGHRDRLPWALIIQDGQVHPFTGQDIPGLCSVTWQSYIKNGKWSSTTYRMAIPDSARLITGHEGWGTGTFLEGLQSELHPCPPIERWVDLANALGVGIPEAQRFLRGYRPEEAARIDEVEAAIASMMAAEDRLDGDVEDITITFGAPTRRQMEAGYWEAPVLVLLDGQEVGRVTPGGEPSGWLSPLAQGRVTVLSVTKSDGYNGGYFSLRLKVPRVAMVYKQ
jgi:hypothetical protein